MIVYVMLQRDADDVATLLIQHGYDAQAYHAGKDSAERSRVQVPTVSVCQPPIRAQSASRALQEEALSGACTTVALPLQSPHRRTVEWGSAALAQPGRMERRQGW